MKSSFSGTLTATATYVDNNGNIQTADCTLTSQTATKFLIEIPNIQAHQLSHKFEIAISTDNGTLKLTGSALTYAQMLLANTEEYTGTAMQDAMIAFYRYSQAADVVKGNPADISKTNGSSNN